MSYADARLDLTPIHVACMSGFNGAGKSAILDAVTWVIWESARSSSDEMIRMGQTEMWVDLCFELEQQVYRVRRSRLRSFPRAGGRIVSKGTLEFQVWDGPPGSWSSALPVPNGNGNGSSEHEGGWKSLTASSMRETQAKICSVLHMDYDTFVNSVYLRQGRADEFTTRLPSERKQVLAEILGLSYYDRMQELAREEVRKRKAQIEVLEGVLTATPELEAMLADTQAECQSLAQKLQQLRAELAAEDEQITALSRECDELRLLESKVEPCRTRISELESDLGPLQVEQQDLEQQIKILEELIASGQAIRTQAEEFTAVKARVEQLDQIGLEVQEHLSQRLEIRSQLATMRGRMEVELDHLRLNAAALVDKRKKLQKEVKNKDDIESKHQKYRALLDEDAELARRQEAFTQLKSRADQLHTYITEARLQHEAKLQQKQSALEEIEDLIKSRSLVSSEQEELRGQAELLDKLEAEFDLVEEKGLKIKGEIESDQVQLKEIARRIAENEEKAREIKLALTSSVCPLCSSPIVDRKAVMARYHNHNEQLLQEKYDLENAVSTLETQRTELRQQYIELRKRLDSRKQLDVRIGEFNAKMSALDRAEENRARLIAEIDTIQAQLTQNSYAHIERESLINVKAEIHKLEFDPILYSNLQSQIRMQRNIEVRYQQLKKDLSELAALDEELPKVEHEIARMADQLKTDDFGHELKKELSAADERINQFNYDRSEHQLQRQKLAQLIPIAERLKELEQADIDKPRLEAGIAQCRNQLTAKENELAALNASLEQWSKRLAQMPKLQTELDERREVRLTLASEKEEEEKVFAVSQARLAQLESEKASLEAKQSQLTDKITEMNDYSFLSEAFGKKGIQAIIIENAVPEIEAEANKILSRLTENQMHVALVTQQKTKQGNLFETLDIIIADEIGTRNYELYSGGEAFKINFAIRVALSRLLARRAGAKLQTLIIDEGFGSQDESSRGRLIRAIGSIKDDFARILVVTHIAEIKELFPVQIFVSKNGGLSEVQLVH